METERSFTEGIAVPQNNPAIMDRSIINRMLASNAVDKRVLDERSVGVYELDIDPSTIAAGEVLTFVIENNVLSLAAMPASSISGVIPANASVDASKINTGSDTPANLEFLQYTTAGLRWSAIPRQTNITADELASGVIPTIPSALPPTANSVDNDSFADDLVIASKHIPALTIGVDDLPTIPYTKLSGTPVIPTALPPTSGSVLPAMINAGGTAEAGKILKLTSATAWGWADDNSGGGSGGVPDNESVTEAKLDAHNDPTSGYALKWDTTNGLYWGQDEDTTYTLSSFVSGTPTTGQVIKQAAGGPAWADEIGLTISGTQATGKYIRATSGTAQEWADFPSIPTIPTTLPPTDNSVDNDSFDDDLVIASKHIPTISYSDLSGAPSSLPPTDDSVGEAAINATDTPTDGEFLQVSIDNSNNRTLNWSSALTGAADSITEAMLAIHNNPANAQVLAWDNTNSRLYWKDDANTTYTLTDFVNGSPSDGDIIRYDADNTRYDYVSLPATPTLDDLVEGTPTDGQFPYWVNANSRFEYRSLPAAPTLPDLVNGTPSATNSAIVWSTTNSRYEVGAFPAGFSVGGTQATNKLVRATSATAQSWANLEDFINGTPTDEQIPSWDATNSRIEWVDKPSGGGSGSGYSETLIYSASGSISSGATRNLNTGESFSDYDAIYFRGATSSGSTATMNSAIISSSSFNTGAYHYIQSGADRSWGVQRVSNSSFRLHIGTTQNIRVYGIRFGSGGGGSGLTIGGTQAAGKFIKSTSGSAQSWADINYTDLVVADGAIPVTKVATITSSNLPSDIVYIDGTPSATNNALRWDTSSSSWKPTSAAGLTIGGTQSANKVLAATSSSAQSWTTLQDLVNGSPADGEAILWDSTNSRLEFGNAGVQIHGTPSSNQIPVWNSSASRWEAGNAPSGNLTVGGTRAAGRTVVATSNSQEWARLSPGDLAVTGTPATGESIVRSDSGYFWGFPSDPGTTTLTYNILTIPNTGLGRDTNFTDNFPDGFTSWTQFASITVGNTTITPTSNSFTVLNPASGVSRVEFNGADIRAQYGPNNSPAPITARGFTFHSDDLYTGNTSLSSSWSSNISLDSGKSFNSYRTLVVRWGTANNSDTNDFIWPEIRTSRTEDFPTIVDGKSFQVRSGTTFRVRGSGYIKGIRGYR